jgi:DNA-binding CsgD family transcriptional regulator
VKHDLDMAARLVTARACGGRFAGGWPARGSLRELAGRAEPESEGWCAAIVDVIGNREPSRILADCLHLQSVTLSNLGRVPEAAGCADRALAMARELGYPFAQAYATNCLAIAASYAGDPGDAVQLAQYGGQIPGIPRPAARVCGYLLASFLAEAGDLAAAEQACAATLTQALDAGDLYALGAVLPVMADLDVQAGRVGDAAAHLREAAQLSLQTGAWLGALDVLDGCGHLCAATGRHAEAVTAWAACAALIHSDWPAEARRREEPLRAARQALGPEQVQAAEQGGAAMSLTTAAEYSLLLTEDPGPRQAPAAPGLPRLSARERELVTLVARGHTDAQIAEQLFISVRTVRSHLDRIRDKTGCRRRADLTRIALQAHLV